MYNQAGVLGLTTAAGVLPFTGVNIVWLIVAGFAVVTAGTALLRLVPRRQG